MSLEGALLAPSGRCFQISSLASRATPQLSGERPRGRSVRRRSKRWAAWDRAGAPAARPCTRLVASLSASSLTPGAWKAHPRGEVSWWGELDDERRNWLRYHIATRAADRECILTLSPYSGPDQVLVLDAIAGRATCALCPWCGQPARKLYVPPSQSQFRCWRCWSLVYRGRTKPGTCWLSAYQRALANPVLDCVAELPQRVRHRPWRTYVEAPPPEPPPSLPASCPGGPRSCASGVCACARSGSGIVRSPGSPSSWKSTVSRLCLEGRAVVSTFPG